MEFKRILAPTDLSGFSEGGVRAAAELAERVGARLTLLHVLSAKELEEIVRAHVPRRPEGLVYEVYERVQETILEQYRRVVPAEVQRQISVEVTVRVGNPVEEILTTTRMRDPNLIVMSTHGLTGVARPLMGSVAEGVVRRASCPVLSVRPREAQVQLAA